YLLSGPTLTIKPAHAADCKCETNPTFDDALGCALASDTAVEELIDRLAGSSAAASVQELAKRQRGVEQTREQQNSIIVRSDERLVEAGLRITSAARHSIGSCHRGR